MTKKLANIIEFYGETCPHCLSMKSVVEAIESEKKVEITKLEVWNNADNQQIMEKYYDIISESCGGLPGVPAFVNTTTKQALCGVHEKADIIALIDGADCTQSLCKPHTKNPKK